MNKHFLILLFAITVIAASCRKEYTDFPYNNIESFTVKDASGKDLQGAIINDQIIVYWPPYQEVPQTIIPEISLAERATIEPASGSQVPFKDGTTFTVRAQDGSIRRYKLMPVINQPPAKVSFSFWPEIVGGSLSASGEYLIPDTSVTELYLINASTQKSTRIWGRDFYSFSFSGLGIQNIPLNIDTGFYNIKLVNGAQTVTQGPFHLGVPFLSNSEISYLDMGKTLKPGEELRVRLANNGLTSKYYSNKVNNLIVTFSDFSELVIPVGSQTATEAKFMIPADCPEGTIIAARIWNDGFSGSESYQFPDNQAITIIH